TIWRGEFLVYAVTRSDSRSSCTCLRGFTRSFTGFMFIKCGNGYNIKDEIATSSSTKSDNTITW
ncbi:unnamed protein product, partial [Hermetia illucens]